MVTEGTRTYQAWKSSPIPAYSKFYFFNMLNAEDFVKNRVKPILEEKGPYTFRERQEKVGLVWHDDGTISYHRRKFWYFEPEMSVGPLTDTVVSLNLPMVTAVNYAKGSFMMEFGLSDMLQTVEVRRFRSVMVTSLPVQATLFINRTVGELLFEGYEDPILEIGASFDEQERTLPMDRFGWFYKVSLSLLLCPHLALSEERDELGGRPVEDVHRGEGHQQARGHQVLERQDPDRGLPWDLWPGEGLG